MRLVAALAATVALAGSAPSAAPVVGFDWSHRRIAWFDPVTLSQLPGRKVPTSSQGVCSWALSPDRARLAYSDCNGTIGFANLRAMKPAGSMYVTGRLGSVDGLAWLRPDRLLATGHVDTGTTLLVIDPVKRKILRRVPLGRQTWGRSVVGDRSVYLLAPWGSYAPAQVAVANADGDVRTVTVDRITVGTIVDDADKGDPDSHTRGAGFAVDPAGGHAYVVSPDLLVADVDLATLSVDYHGPTRVLAKSVDGPTRYARWLGGGLLAVSGADWTTSGTGASRTSVATPYGLHIVDTRTWTVRTVDAQTDWFRAGPGVMIVERGPYGADHSAVAYGLDGRERYRVALPPEGWYDVPGAYGYVCAKDALVRVLDAATGAEVASPRGRSCVLLLTDEAAG